METEDAALVVMIAITSGGYQLVTNTKGKTNLIGKHCMISVPEEVMNFLVEKELIEIESLIQ
jgi:hypothetical protein